jgi:hypothetical protein
MRRVRWLLLGLGGLLILSYLVYFESPGLGRALLAEAGTRGGMQLAAGA